MFGIVDDARRVALTPLGENLESVGELPVAQRIRTGSNARFFLYFTPCCFDQAFAVFLTAGD